MSIKKHFLLLALSLLFSGAFCGVVADVVYADHEPGHIGGPGSPTTGGGSQPTTGGGSQPTTGGGSQPTVGGTPGINPNVVMFDPIDKSIEEIFLAILDIIMVFAVPIVLFFIVWAGFLYVTARGDTSQLEKAHKALLYAVIGGVIVLGAQALLYVITNTIRIFG